VYFKLAVPVEPFAPIELFEPSEGSLAGS